MLDRRRQILATDSRAVPIYQTTSMFLRIVMCNCKFNLSDSGNIYGRLTNPTESVFEERIASLEGGIAALAVASGSAAITYSILNIAHSGDHVVAAKNIYGGSFNLLSHTVENFGIESSFVDPFDYDEVESAIKVNTKLLFIESLGNPNSEVVDIEKLTNIAHSHNIP